MTQLIPSRFLFDFEFPLRYMPVAPALDGRLAGWTDAYLLPPLHEIDGMPAFAPVWMAWNERGLFVACCVEGRRRPLRCEPESFWRGDNLRICTDMRDARTIKRASKFCQQFYLLATGGGPKHDRPVAGSARFNRAREHAPDVPDNAISIASKVTADGYTLEAHIPASALSGFDPTDHPRIGLYYILEDTDLGQQYLTVGDDLYWYVDPSTWATAVLTR